MAAKTVNEEEKMPMSECDDVWVDILMNMAVVIRRKGIKGEVAEAILDHIQWNEEKKSLVTKVFGHGGPR